MNHPKRPREPHVILGVSPKATKDEIKAAYRRLVPGCHPDLHPGDSGATDRFRELVAAVEAMETRDGGTLSPWAQELVDRWQAIGDAVGRYDIPGALGGMQQLAEGIQGKVTQMTGRALEVHGQVVGGLGEAKEFVAGALAIWDHVRGKKS